MGAKRWMAGFGLLALVGCGGGDDNPFTIPDRIEALENCLPGAWEKTEVILEAVEAWKLMEGDAPDPAGLAWVETAGGEIDVTYTLTDCTLDMTISFHLADGSKQDLDLTGATTLAQAIDLAATELRELAGGGSPFLLGVWTLTGTNVSGTGALTGVIGGTENQNELERLKTTAAVAVGGEPAIESGFITTDGGNCEFEFRFSDLQTDTVVPQEYPIGTINITVRDPDATAHGSITFDGTVVAVAEMNGVPGDFDLNLETGAVHYNG